MDLKSPLLHANLSYTSFLPRCTQINFFEILLNQTEIILYFPFSDWFGTKRTSVWFQISLKMVNTIWLQVDLIRFWRDFSVCIRLGAQTQNNLCELSEEKFALVFYAKLRRTLRYVSRRDAGISFNVISHFGLHTSRRTAVRETGVSLRQNRTFLFSVSLPLSLDEQNYSLGDDR